MDIFKRIRAYGADHPTGVALTVVVWILADILVLWQYFSNEPPIPIVAHAVSAGDARMRYVLLAMVFVALGLFAYIARLARTRPSEIARRANRLEDETRHQQVHIRQLEQAIGRVTKHLENEQIFRAGAEARAEEWERKAAEVGVELLSVSIERDDLRAEVTDLEAELAGFRPPPPPPPITQLEQVGVDDLRVLFKVVGDDASRRGLRLLEAVREHLAPTNPLAPQLSPDIDDLRKARHAVEIRLQDGSGVRLEVAQEYFAQMHKQYMRCVRWFHLAAGDQAVRNMSQEDYWEWRPVHDRFRSEAERTCSREALGYLRNCLEEVGWGLRFRDDMFGFNPERTTND